MTALLPSLDSVGLYSRDKEGITMGRNSINRWSQNFACLITLMTMMVVGTLPALAAAGTFTTSTSFPFDIVVFVSCANGGAGGDVGVSGTVHDLFHVTFDNVGGLHIKALDNPQGISGVGLTTGAKYQATGGTQSEFNAKVGLEETDVNNFRIIGQGPGNNFLVHDNFHVTVNANGTITAVHDNFSIDCK